MNVRNFNVLLRFYCQIHRMRTHLFKPFMSQHLYRKRDFRSGTPLSIPSGLGNFGQYCRQLFALLSCGLLISLNAFGQDVKDVEATLIGYNQVVVDYLLKDNDSIPGRIFTVELYAILNQKDTLKLDEVTGDVGPGILAGLNSITWDLEEELGRYKGSIVFEVRATPVFVITRPVESTVLKRGTSYTFFWYGGGSHNDSLTLHLYRYNEYISTLATVSDKNKFIWRIPPNTKIGAGFTLRVLGTDKTGIDEYSAPFIIRRRVPLLYKVLPPLVVAGGVLFFLQEREGPLPEPPGEPTF